MPNHSYLQVLNDYPHGTIVAKSRLDLGEHFKGCFLGLALGDATGAPFEGGIVERFVWRLIGKTKNGANRWTDDTQMALDVAESLNSFGGVNQNDLAIRFGKSYQWSRGYGPSTAKILKKMRKGGDWRQLNRSVFPSGSFGNGAAMRAPIIGMFFCNKSVNLLQEATEQSAVITHAHPMAIEGARIIALATSLAIAQKSADFIIKSIFKVSTEKTFQKQISLVKGWFENQILPNPQEVRKHLGNGVAAGESCMTAIYIALRFISLPFAEMTSFVLKCGGDTDTIAAMAGSIWGAYNGEQNLPATALLNLEDADRIRAIAASLARKVKSP